MFAITLIEAPQDSGSWAWDSANALGFLGFSTALYLCLHTGAGKLARTHQAIGYALLACIWLHVVWLLVMHPAVWHYLSWDAPAYMLAGFAGALLFTTTVVLALPGWRRMWHPNHPTFRRWHVALPVIALPLTLWHMLGSGFYLSLYEGIAYVVLTALVVVLQQTSSVRTQSGSRSLVGLPILALGFVLVKLA